jgi:hypothetical protein
VIRQELDRVRDRRRTARIAAGIAALVAAIVLSVVAAVRISKLHDTASVERDVATELFEFVQAERGSRPATNGDADVSPR